MIKSNTTLKPKKRAPGGGRKLKYGESVKRVDFKCPESKIKEFRESANKILKTYVKKSKN